MQIAYLVGQISPKFPVTYEWRRKIEQHFKENDEIDFINPCRNPFNQKGLKKNSYAVTREKRSFGIDLLVPKDRSFVKRSTMAIVNMNQYDVDKCLLGSFFELAWYYDHPEKAVIAFADDLNEYQCQHPFVQQSVTTWARDVGEACYLVEKYFTSV